MSTPRPWSAAPPFTTARFAEVYERTLVGPLFAPWAEELLARVPLAPHARVLDVACGTGIVARLARRRTRGRIVGVDLSPAMLAAARVAEPSVDWREGDATALPIADGERFDAVFCQQGVQFFADRAAAAGELRRAAAPGARVAVAVWRALDDHALFRDLHEVAERFLGPVADRRHGFPDGDALGGLLEAAGFSDVRVEAVGLEARFDAEPLAFAYLNAMALAGMTAGPRPRSPEERAEVAAAIAEASLGVVARYVTGGTIACPTSANVATGRA